MDQRALTMGTGRTPPDECAASGGRGPHIVRLVSFKRMRRCGKAAVGTKSCRTNTAQAHEASGAKGVGGSHGGRLTAVPAWEGTAAPKEHMVSGGHPHGLGRDGRVYERMLSAA